MAKPNAEELGMWIADNPVLNSAKINHDVETIVNEARKELDPTITVADVEAAAKAYQEATRKAQEAAEHGGVAASGTAEGKTV